MDSHPSDPGSPPYAEPRDWITGYLMVHSMSKPSYRVAFILWIVIASLFFVSSVLHLIGTNRPSIFAGWSKWALRRRTWRKHAGKQEAERTGRPHIQPTPLPSNSQLISLAFLFILTMILCFVGPDYLAPRRPPGITGPPPSSTPQKRTVSREEIDQYVAYYTISKSWWTVAGRTGNIAFALFPLCILFGLKAAPFAIFALPYTIQLSFDKLSIAHRWVGRLIYFITVIHVVCWSIQLATTKNPVTGRTAYIYAWLYPPFIWGWVAFVAFTILIASSFRFFRYNFYESFYALHVILVPLTLSTAGIHYRPIGWWCWGALVVWAAERAWRAAWWCWVNGIFKGKRQNTPSRGESQNTLSREGRQNTSSREKPPQLKESGPDLKRGGAHLNDFWEPNLTRRDSRMPTMVETLTSPPEAYVPPPGYALAELMPGKTVRLTVLTPECRPWAPGQYFLLCIPSINKFTSHPFFSCSICDQQSSSPAGRVLTFLIRAKIGWTKTLWDNIVALSASDEYHWDGEKPPKGTRLPSRGVLLSTFVEGPFGSVARTDWIEYSSVILVGGGTGVAFTLSVFVYLCLVLSGRASQYLGGHSKAFSKVRRVRLVWLAREFSHLAWCASILRRCISLVPNSALQVDIFVTNIPKDTASKPPPGANSSRPPRVSWTPAENPLTLNPVGDSNMLDVSLDPNSLPLRTPYDPPSGRRYHDGGLKGSDYDYELGMGHSRQDTAYDVLDDTHFNGDLDEHVTPAEQSFNTRLRQEGVLRRKMARKVTVADQEQLWVDLGQQVGSPTPILTPGHHETGMGHSRQDTAHDVLDDTHFNGDLDEGVTPAEQSSIERLGSAPDVPSDSNSRTPIHPVAPSEGSLREEPIDHRNSLLTPNPHDGTPGGRDGDGGLQSKDSDNEMGLGQQDTAHKVLDDTHFEGDLGDYAIPVEESSNGMLGNTPDVPSGSNSRIPVHPVAPSEGSRREEHIDNYNSLLAPNPYGPPSGGRYHDGGSKGQDHDYDLGVGHSRKDTAYDVLDDTHFNGDLGGYVTLAEESLNRRLRQEGMLSRMEQQDQELFGGSLREQVSDLDAVRAMLPKTVRGAQNVEVELEFTDEEVEDMLAVTEFTWPGRPMLDRMLWEEVSNAKGAIVVACCGPTQLNASIRKIVAAQIDPYKIKRGDKTGFIACVTEEFDY